MTTKTKTHKTAALSTSALQAKFTTMREDMRASLIERDSEIDVVLTAMLCREHVNLVGRPGTAKSLLLDTVMQWVSVDPTQGERDLVKVAALLSKHTSPEELFGPVSIAGLKNDQYRRQTTGRLPEASFAFLDEIYKAGPAILNTLLRILNERQFDNGAGGLVECPLMLCVAASNEWPNDQDNGKELGALFDRFLFRKVVKPVSKAGRRRLLRASNLRPTLTTSITLKEIEAACDLVDQVPFTDAAWKTLDGILDALNGEGIFPGDRRMRKAVTAAKAYAFLHGAAEVEPVHLEILAHVLWDDPAEQPEICAKVVAKLANPEAARVTELLVQVTDVLAKSTPTEAVPKLQAIKKEMDSMGSQRAVEAVQFISREIKRRYDAVIGA